MKTLFKFASIFVIYILSLNVFGDNNVAQVFLYMDNKEWQRAEALAQQHSKVLTKLVLSQKLLDKNYCGNSFEGVVRFLHNNPDWPQYKLLATRAEEYLDYNSNKKLIVDWFHKRPPVTGIGYKFYALAASSLIKDKKKLTAIIKKAWIYGDFTIAEENAYYSRWHKFLSSEDHIRRIDELLWKSDIQAAESSLKYVSSGYQKSFKVQIAIIKQHSNVKKLFKEVPEKYYTDGLIYRYLDFKKTTAPFPEDIILFKKVKTSYKHSDKWQRLQLYYAREFIDYKDFVNSYNTISIPLTTELHLVREREWFAGWLALSFLKKPSVALGHFSKFSKVVHTPISRSRAFYWTGRAHEAKGEKKLAYKFYSMAASYPYTFYGQVASVELNKRKLAFPIKPSVTKRDRQAVERNDVVKAIKLLIKYNKAHLASTYAKVAIENAGSAGEIVLIVDVIKQINKIHYTVEIAKVASQYGAFIIEDSFPAPYKPLRSPVDLHLVYSIIRQESVFNPSAVSCANAMGLMQLIKGTACDTAKALNTKCDIARLTKDPAYNIMLGSHYLKKLLQDHNGSYVLAIASYNAGSSKVIKWIEKFGDPRNSNDMRNIIDWIELIPYSETRNYVQRVLESMQVYRFLFVKNASLQLKGDLHACKVK